MPTFCFPIRFYALLFVVLATLTGLQVNDSPAAFQAALQAGKMTFTPPPGWTETPVLPDTKMDYQLALRHPSKRLEVRYYVQPLAPLLADYKRDIRNKNPEAMDPNLLYRGLFQAVALDVTGGPEPEVGQFPDQAIHKEFNADWGATTLVVPQTKFAQDYKLCMVMGIHKQNAADAYYFYLFDDKATFQEFMKSPEHLTVFHSLRFQ